MMADGVFVTEIFNLFPELPEIIQRAVIRATKKAAFDIQREAATNHPFQNQTGFLESSIYVKMKNTSSYGHGVMDIPDGAELLPEVESPPKPTIAYIAVGADYGIYVEMGTVNMPAFPYLVPAAELIFPQYEAAMKALGDTLELPPI